MRPNHRPNHRFVVERLLTSPPAGSARTIKRVWQKLGHFGRLAAAERALINSAIDSDNLIRIREVR
jgi:hypothetical protein